jgi:hypothetical protein
MGTRVLTVTFCPDLAVPSVCTEHVRHLALLTKVPALVTIRTLASGLFASCAMIFGGTGSKVTDGQCVGSERGRGKWHISGAGKV